MPRLSQLTSTLTSVLPCVGGSSVRTRSSSRQPAEPELAQWLARRAPTEDGTGAIKVIEAAEKEHPRRVALSRRGLKDLPTKVSSLVDTEQLDLSHNQLARWPEQIGGLGKLTHLNVSSNMLNVIPEGVALHTRLESLNARSNHISAISQRTAELRHLHTLDLSVNGLTAVPPEILGLPELKKLSLANNKIGKLCPLVRLYKLKELDLSNNPLGAIPDVPADPANAPMMSQLPAAKLPAGLETLNLANTMLEDIPTSLALPEHLGELKELTYLDVSSNPLLHKLPLGFGAFKKAGSDEVVSLKSPNRPAKLTVFHQGSGVVQGLEQDGRLKSRAGSNPGGGTAPTAASPYGGNWDASSRGYVHRQRGVEPPSSYGPWQGAV
jgi:hypothetical protein